MGAAVAVVLIKERHVAEAFEHAGATTPDRARVPEELGVHIPGVGWRRLRRREIVRDVGQGRFYLDVPSWEASIRTRRLRMIVLLVVLLAAAMALGLIGPWRR